MTDRHRLRTLGGIRLDSADDDTWIRAYAERIGQPVRKVVIRAVRELRARVENEPADECDAGPDCY